MQNVIIIKIDNKIGLRAMILTPNANTMMIASFMAEIYKLNIKINDNTHCKYLMEYQSHDSVSIFKEPLQ